MTLATNAYGEAILTGNETPKAFARLLAELLERAMDEEFSGTGNGRIEVRAKTESYQPYLEIELANGATWQLTPVRSGWPDDGSSAQWADIEEGE